MAVCQESRPSLEDILSRYDLKKVNLEAECPREVRNDIAVRLDNWEIVGFYLDFSLEKIREIDRENRAQELCKLALLDAWGKKEGKRATYVKLARALHRSQRNDLVEFLCTKVKSTTMGVVAVSTSGEDTSGSDTLDSRQLQPYAGKGDHVFERIEKLEREFGLLHQRLVSTLTSGEPEVYIDELLQALTMLPLAFRKEYESEIQQMLPNLEKRQTIQEIFRRLNPLFSFIDYELLGHLISRFGDTSLKEDMKTYVGQMKWFKRQTTIGDLIDCWPGHNVDGEDKLFKKLTAKFQHDPKTYTLEKLDSFRRVFCNRLRLSEFISVFVLKSVEATSSFRVVWLIPTVIVQHVVLTVRPLGPYLRMVKSVVSMSVDGIKLFQDDYKNSTSAESKARPSLRQKSWSLDLGPSVQPITSSPVIPPPPPPPSPRGSSQQQSMLSENQEFVIKRSSVTSSIEGSLSPPPRPSSPIPFLPRTSPPQTRRMSSPVHIPTSSVYITPGARASPPPPPSGRRGSPPSYELLSSPPSERPPSPCLSAPSSSPTSQFSSEIKYTPVAESTVMPSLPRLPRPTPYYYHDVMEQPAGSNRTSTTTEPISTSWKSKLQEYYVSKYQNTDFEIEYMILGNLFLSKGIASTVVCPDGTYANGTGSDTETAENNAAYNALKQLGEL